MLEDAAATADTGLVFKGGDVDWNKAIMLTVTDASWANEKDTVRGKMEDYRSQRARFNGLAGAGFVEGSSDYAHPICITSNVIRRACKYALQAETQAMIWGVESRTRIRAAIVGARGLLGNARKISSEWEEISACSMRHVWMTDCKSLAEHLTAATMGQGRI